MSILEISANSISSDKITKKYFGDLLTTMWLRPERALMESHMMSVVQKFIPKSAEKSLEWGCADGSVSFVMLGGEYNFNYDDYLEVEWINNSKKAGSGVNTDFFDVIADIDVNPVKKPSDFIFSNGLSWKQSHIAKASRLGFHESLHAQDFNEQLHFPDNYFDFILATNLFWIDNENDLTAILKDLARVMNINGKIISIFPQSTNCDFIVADKLKGADVNWINMLDRGISKNLLYNARDLQQFEKIAERCGLRIVNAVSYCPSLISTIYQIGFRPMFPVFMSMYEILKKASPDKFLDIKKQWIDTVSDFMMPLCESKWMMEKNLQNTWYCFEFEKI